MTWIFFPILLLLALAGNVPMARAQSLGVRGLATWPEGEDLAPVRGAEVTLQLRRLPLVLSVGAQRGSRAGPFVFCAGLVPPGADCSPQPADIRAELYTGSLGFALAREHGAWSARLAPSVGGVWVRSEWNSHTSDERWTHRRAAASVGLELEVGRRMGGALPLRVSTGVRGAQVLTTWPDCDDCFVASYDAGFPSGSVFAGLEYRFR